jgi:hypothetical protein
MQHTLMTAAVLLMAGGVASAQLAVPPGQDIQKDSQLNAEPSTGSGYGAPYSPRNAPAADVTNGRSPNAPETTGQASQTVAPPTFEDRWSAQAAVPYLPPDAAIPDATTGRAQMQKLPASKDLPYIPE